MKLLIPLLAAQFSAVMLVQNHQNLWDVQSIASVIGLVSTSGFLVFNMLNYKR